MDVCSLLSFSCFSFLSSLNSWWVLFFSKISYCCCWWVASVVSDSVRSHRRQPTTSGKYPTSFWPRRKSTCWGSSRVPQQSLRELPWATRHRWAKRWSWSKGAWVAPGWATCLLSAPWVRVPVHTYRPDDGALCPARRLPLALLTVIPHFRGRAGRPGLISAHASFPSLCPLLPGFLECSLDTLGRFQFKTF